MLRVAKQGVFVGQLHQAAQIHHTHLVTHMAHHGQVVTDEQIRQAALALQVFHDVEHLRLHTHIERRGWLITHQKLGCGGQGAGYRDALALSTRELVWVLDHIERRQAHRLEQLGHTGLELFGIADQAVLFERFTNDVVHRPARVQAGVGVLENHLNALAHGLGMVRLESRVGVLPVKGQAAACGLVQAHQQAGHRAFAAA